MMMPLTPLAFIEDDCLIDHLLWIKIVGTIFLSGNYNDFLIVLSLIFVALLLLATAALVPA